MCGGLGFLAQDGSRVNFWICCVIFSGVIYTFDISVNLFCNRRIATEESGIQPLLIGSIREALIEQEDTLIYSLLQRAQYCYNAPTYDKNCFAIPGFEGSLIEYMLQETEHLHAKVGFGYLSVSYSDLWVHLSFQTLEVICWVKLVISVCNGKWGINAQVRRYSAPDEHPFFPIGLPEPILPPLQQIKVSMWP